MKINRRFWGTCHIHFQSRRISQDRNQHEEGSKQRNPLAESLGLWRKIKGSETSVDLQRNTRRYVPEDKTLHSHGCKNPKSCEETQGSKLRSLVNTVKTPLSSIKARNFSASCSNLKTCKWSWNKQKFGHGSQRDRKSSMFLLAKASNNFPYCPTE
jgi:hypothetical protein